MNKIKTLALSLALIIGTAFPAFAALPWASADPLEVSGATPTCTYTSTSFACIEDMTANVTAITLAGMTAGQYYTLILMQDGTGSRTLVQTSVSGSPGLQTGETAANTYAVWRILATSATKATWVADYSNASLADYFTATQASNGTSLTTATYQAQPTVVVPGMSASSECLCEGQTYPTTWQVGIGLTCLPETNAVQCLELNPTATTQTPAAVTLNIRIVRP